MSEIISSKIMPVENDLCETSLEYAIELMQDAGFGKKPKILLVSLNDAITAGIMKERFNLLDMDIVVIPYSHQDSWALVGETGMIYSTGV